MLARFGELEPGATNLRGEGLTHGTQVGLTSFDICECRFPSGTNSPPDVQLPAEVEHRFEAVEATGDEVVVVTGDLDAEKSLL